MRKIVFVVLFTVVVFVTQGVSARVPLAQLSQELSRLSSHCSASHKEIHVLLKSAEVHLVCGRKIQSLRAVVVQHAFFLDNYPVLPRTTRIEKVELFPTWKRTQWMIAQSCKKGRCKSGKRYSHGHPSNPFDLGKIFLVGMGAIRIHDVSQTQKKRLRVFERESDRYASSGCVNLQTHSLKRLLAFIGYDPLDKNAVAYKNIPIIFTNG